MRNLITIENTPYNIIIVGNKFEYNTVVKGLIYITNADKRSKPVLIADNNFINNGAYYGAIGIYIR
jgi:hypothetical protein